MAHVPLNLERRGSFLAAPPPFVFAVCRFLEVAVDRVNELTQCHLFLWGWSLVADHIVLLSLDWLFFNQWLQMTG